MHSVIMQLALYNWTQRHRNDFVLSSLGSTLALDITTVHVVSQVESSSKGLTWQRSVNKFYKMLGLLVLKSNESRRGCRGVEDEAGQGWSAREHRRTLVAEADVRYKRIDFGRHPILESTLRQILLLLAPVDLVEWLVVVDLWSTWGLQHCCRILQNACVLSRNLTLRFNVCRACCADFILFNRYGSKLRVE